MEETKAEETLPATCIISYKTPDSDESSPISTIPTTAGEKPKNTNNKDPETDREAKRRKNSPTELISSEPIRSGSFTFDTKFATTPDSTPKFGSFKLLESAAEGDKAKDPELSPAREGEEDVGGEEFELSEREIGEVLSSVDGITSSD